MRIPIKWLAEYVDIKGLTPKKISDGLRFSGTENVLVELSSYEKIIVGEIKSVKKHPNADKLSIAIVSDGKNDLQIVCGAKNIKKGQKVPLALVGAEIDGFKIKKAKIRGIESQGMMCSEKELGLGEDHSGIMILDKGAKVGMRFADYVGKSEAIIDAEITPNRGDCLSMVGIAREVAATFDRKLKKIDFKKKPVNSNKKVTVDVKDKKLCPRYIAKVVDGVQVKPSPKWMQERLLAAGVRPISNVVDITNYVMLEWGQPLHAFDYNKISGRKIIVRRAKAGEKMKTLDGVERRFTNEDLLICDSQKPIAVAGVMGGENSEVSENTKTIVLEAAAFNSNSVRKTAQRLANRTEASNRFEKGIPLQLPEIAIERAAQLLSEIAGGKVGENIDILSEWIWLQHVGLRKSRLEKFLGIKISEETVLQILRGLGFKAENFDFRQEARRHVGKPYVFGAKFKTHGDMAFDCSYLIDYIYSLIGKFVGYTSLAQYYLGRPVAESELQPGDVLFLKGVVDKSATDHYFIPDGQGGYKKVDCPKTEVGHSALYIGDGRIVHARHYEYRDGKWRKLPDSKAKVIEENVDSFLKHPEYLGARRYIDNPDDWIAVDVPWWRLDVKIEEDLIEEIIRIYGYDKLKSTLPSGEIPKQNTNKRVTLFNKVREQMVSNGFWEIYTYSFVSKETAEFMGGVKDALKISNPLSQDQEYMRKNVIPSLVQVIGKNQDYYDDIKIFEIANVYSVKGKERVEAPMLGAAVKMKSGKEEAFSELKGALESLLSKYGDVAFTERETANFKKGQVAAVKLNNKEVGLIGIISEDLKKFFDVKYEVCAAFIDLDNLGDEKPIKYRGIPKYPHSKRDVNLVFPSELTIEKINEAIARKNIKGLISYSVVDVYKGKGITEGEKSVTIRLEIGSDNKTMQEEEISQIVNSVVKGLEKLGGKIRQ